MEKRRDDKKRILRNGESQRKDGRYRYKYIDARGMERDVYSWRLDINDPLPKGKRPDLSLREKEQLIEKDIREGIISNTERITVYSLCKKYCDIKRMSLAESTWENYNCRLRMIEKNPFGSVLIDKVKQSDAKRWLSGLNSTYKYGTIEAIKGILSPAFEMAKEDDLIRKNPFDFRISEILTDDTTPKISLSQEEEKAFLDFVRKDKVYDKYYDEFYILFNTGLRISEFCGLTMSDIDFNGMKINVDHQLVRLKDRFAVKPPKTKTGKRQIPMTMEVMACFRRLASKPRPRIEPMVDGLAGFIILSRDGSLSYANIWDRRMKAITRKFNEKSMLQLPTLTPHICRHTFCSKMARQGMNPKTLQYIMGHADISITLNTYTHFCFEDIQKEMRKIAP